MNIEKEKKNLQTKIDTLTNNIREKNKLRESVTDNSEKLNLTKDIVLMRNELKTIKKQLKHIINLNKYNIKKKEEQEQEELLRELEEEIKKKEEEDKLKREEEDKLNKQLEELEKDEEKKQKENEKIQEEKTINSSIKKSKNINELGFRKTLKQKPKENKIILDSEICKNIFKEGSNVVNKKYFVPSQIPTLTSRKTLATLSKKGGRKLFNKRTKKKFKKNKK